MMGFHQLGNLAHEVNVQKPILQARASDFDIVGQLKAALERTRGDPSVEQLTRLLAADCQRWAR
jgi:hypothetical protein